MSGEVKEERVWSLLSRIYLADDKDRELHKILFLENHAYDTKYQIAKQNPRCDIKNDWFVSYLDDEHLTLFLINPFNTVLTLERVEMLASNPAFWDISKNDKAFLKFFTSSTGRTALEPQSMIISVLPEAKDVAIKTMIEKGYFTDETAALLLKVLNKAGAADLVFEWYKNKYDLGDNYPNEWIKKALSI